MAAVGKREADDNMKPECVISSSGYDPIMSEETYDEDICNDTDRSSSHENHILPINIKEEAVKLKAKEEDDVSTDDSLGYVMSSSGYDPVKGEETDEEDTNNTSNEHQHLPIKEQGEIKVLNSEIKVLNSSSSANDEHNKKKRPGRGLNSPQSVANGTAQPRSTVLFGVKKEEEEESTDEEGYGDMGTPGRKKRIKLEPQALKTEEVPTDNEAEEIADDKTSSAVANRLKIKKDNVEVSKSGMSSMFWAVMCVYPSVDCPYHMPPLST